VCVCVGHKFNFQNGDKAESRVACVCEVTWCRVFVTCNCNKTNNRRNFVTLNVASAHVAYEQFSV